MQVHVNEWWWDEDDLCIKTDTREMWRLSKPWVSNIHFNGLDYSTSETSTIVLEQRYSEKKYERSSQ